MNNNKDQIYLMTYEMFTHNKIIHAEKFSFKKSKMIFVISERKSSRSRMPLI
jgi:hypothetical protein